MTSTSSGKIRFTSARHQEVSSFSVLHRMMSSSRNGCFLVWRAGFAWFGVAVVESCTSGFMEFMSLSGTSMLISLKIFPIMREMVLSVSSFYFALDLGGTMIMDKVLGFSPSSSYFVL
jgi:hypothetical protein